MSADKRRWLCTECGAVSKSRDLLHIEHPFDGPEVTLTACPKCKSVAGETDLQLVCDEPRCRSVATCGTPTPDGYRNTCYNHRPEQP